MKGADYKSARILSYAIINAILRCILYAPIDLWHLVELLSFSRTKVGYTLHYIFIHSDMERSIGHFAFDHFCNKCCRNWRLIFPLKIARKFVGVETLRDGKFRNSRRLVIFSRLKSKSVGLETFCKVARGGLVSLKVRRRSNKSWNS